MVVTPSRRCYWGFSCFIVLGFLCIFASLLLNGKISHAKKLVLFSLIFCFGLLRWKSGNAWLGEVIIKCCEWNLNIDCDHYSQQGVALLDGGEQRTLLPNILWHELFFFIHTWNLCALHVYSPVIHTFLLPNFLKLDSCYLSLYVFWQAFDSQGNTVFDLSFASISHIHLSDNKRQDLNSAVVFNFGVVISAIQTHTRFHLIVYYFKLERVQKWFWDCNLLTDKLRRCDMV